MKKLFKYIMSGKERMVEIPMPIGAKIISIGNQLEKISIWAEVETTAPNELRVFHILSTGDELKQNSKYIGTVVLRGGTSVSHIYEERKCADMLI